MASRIMLTAEQMIDRFGSVDLDATILNDGTKICTGTNGNVIIDNWVMACAELRLPDNCPNIVNIKTLILSGIAESIYVYKTSEYQDSVAYLFTRLDNHPWLGTISEEY